jgi:FixJ family two-component response regulator
MSPDRVYIVDDDAAVRDSLRMLCETAGLEVECHDGAESFLATAHPDRPGCLVLDVRMGRMSGPELHAELNRRGSRLPIIYLTAHGNIPMTVLALKEGAVDFLTKPVNGAELLDRIQAALQRSREQWQHEAARSDGRRRLALLTPREREILGLALSGLGNKAIAIRLGISHRTVEIHRSHLLSKCETASLLELAQLAADCGYPLDDAPPQPESPA